MLKRVLATTSAMCLASAGAWAATAQGTKGATSAPTIDVQLIVLKEVKLSNVATIDLGTFAGADITVTDTICAFMNVDAAYQVNFTSANGAFQLDDSGDSNPFPYTVRYDDVGDGTNYAAVLYNTPLVGRNTQANTTDDDCVTAGGDNATLEIKVTSADVGASADDTYNDTITITMSPNF